MKIRDLQCYAVPSEKERFSTKNWVILLIKTDQGLDGVGEATLAFPFDLSRQVIAAVEGTRDYLIGRDPSRIEKIWADLYDRYFWRGGPVEMTALGAIDQALWDIAGKAASQPVYKLLGGAYHDRIQIYHNAWWKGTETPDDVVAKAKQTVGEGATALKWYPFDFLPQLKNNYQLTSAEMNRGIDEVLAVRDAVGPDVTLMVDVWRRLDLNSAITFCNAIREANLLFVEEPVFAENINVMEKLSRAVSQRLATGERLLNRWEFRQLIERQVVGIVQPDVPRVGGITEARKIATMADAYGIGVAPHNPTGSVATAAAVHMCIGLRNFVLLERFVPFTPQDYVAHDLSYGPDYITLPTAPGMGITVDERALSRIAAAA